MEGSVAGPAQGAPPAGTQPGATGQGEGGQGQPTGQGQGSNFNWGLFPTVPENQRELLQPHLTNVLGHVTRMEQQYAPYKGLMDTVQPDDVQGLLTFLSNYNTDPVATWLGLAESLQQNGAINNPQFSLDALQALVQGQAPGAQAQGPQGEMGDMPPWAQAFAQQMQGITSWIEQQQQVEQQRQEADQQREQQAMLQTAHQTVREQLKAAGIPDSENLITDEQITAQIIVHQGDLQRVVASFTGLRDGFLGNFTNQHANGSRPPTVQGGAPETPKNGVKGRKGDGFRQASVGAQQFLQQAAQAQGQGN